MSYTTFDYLSDLSVIAAIPFRIVKKILKLLEIVFNKATEIEYDTYLLRILENLPYGLLILYLGFLGVFTLFRLTEKTNGVRIFSIATSSMTPTISPGSMVLTKGENSYKKGDIITFIELNPTTRTQTGRTLTHRVIGINSPDGDYITKGDSNSNPDPIPVPEKNILGKVSYVVGFIGYFDLAIRTLPGFIVLILIPCLILIKNEAVYLKKERLRPIPKS